jgi:(p)ppGpp synthase/HD superfamily hydrolase
MPSEDRFAWLWQKAVSFAARKHQGQFRRDGRTPYVAHPVRVALLLRHLFQIAEPAALCAALLHDTLEDTRTDYDELAREFGLEVADLVAALSKDPRLPAADREREYRARISRAPWQAMAVKLADVYDNLSEGEPGSDSLATTLLQARWVLQMAEGHTELALAREKLRELVRSKEGEAAGPSPSFTVA